MNEELRIKNDELRIQLYSLTLISFAVIFQLSTINYHLSSFIFQLSTINYHLSTINYFKYWPLSTQRTKRYLHLTPLSP